MIARRPNVPATFRSRLEGGDGAVGKTAHGALRAQDQANVTNASALAPQMGQ